MLSAGITVKEELQRCSKPLLSLGCPKNQLILDVFTWVREGLTTASLGLPLPNIKSLAIKASLNCVTCSSREAELCQIDSDPLSQLPQKDFLSTMSIRFIQHPFEISTMFPLM